MVEQAPTLPENIELVEDKTNVPKMVILSNILGDGAQAKVY